MFDLLKKKLSNFVKRVSGKAKAPEQEELEQAEHVQKQISKQAVQQIREPRPQKPERKKETASAEKPLLEKREIKPELKAPSKIKAVFRKEIALKESDITDMLFELELSLLEADVNEGTAKHFCEEIKKRLLADKIPAKDIESFVKERIKEILRELMQTEQIDLISMIKSSEKPFKILFLGPNGAGKTTTIAKLTVLLREQGLSSIWAASDTFRAASIEQLEEHAKKLGVRLVKHSYGADPAAVAFDAISAAKSSGIDVVMIDTAGRQETNRNLIEELKKIARVVNPDLKIFVGEAFAGKNLVEQAKQFDDAIGIDAFVITKLDTDAKGGTMLSLLHEIKKPVVFIGTGQAYKDLQRFNIDEILERIV